MMMRSFEDKVLTVFVMPLSIVITPAVFVGIYYVFMWAVTAIGHFGKSFFVKGGGGFNFEWFPYWRVNLHIENDYSYQDWLHSSIKFINDNLQIINDFANDFEGGFLTRVAVFGIFLLPITIPIMIGMLYEEFVGWKK